MTNDLGVWTADDCALGLIDYQKEMFEVIRSETSADLVEMHVRLLAKTAKAFAMPIVPTTVGVGAGFNGPTLPSIQSEFIEYRSIGSTPSSFIVATAANKTPRRPIHSAMNGTAISAAIVRAAQIA